MVNVILDLVLGTVITVALISLWLVTTWVIAMWIGRLLRASFEAQASRRSRNGAENQL